MKFPKSVHAEGWADHIDKTEVEGARKVGVSTPLHATKAHVSGMPLNSPTVTPSMSTTPPVMPTVTPRVDPVMRPQPVAAATARPAQGDRQTPWIVVATGGAVVVGALAVWAMNRPSEAPSTPPAIVTGSVEPQAVVAAATPEPAPQADRDTAATDTAAASAAPAEPTPAPARLGPPVTTVRPAADARPVAQAAVPAPRPDLVVRANPRDEAPAAQPTPYLQPLPTVAAAPVAPAIEVQPLAVTPGTAPITLPPTAAGPTPGTAPLAAVTPPPATPEPATATAPIATSPGTPPLAQATTPSPEDSGITQKVRSALAADSTLAAVPIAVSTDHGVVKLEGQAPDAPTRERATVVASSTSGVKAVDNRLTLAPAPMVSQAPSGL